MNDIQIFKNEEFGEVRTLVVNNEPWLVGNDVAKALGYGEGKSLPNAINNHVDKDDKGVTKMMTPGGNQQVTIINESGFYSLVLSSKLPTAKKFKRWVTSEVLPSIRKHGAYMTEQTLNKALMSPDFLISLATQLKAEQEKLADAKNKIARQHDRIGTLEGHLRYNIEEVKKLTPDAEYTRKTLSSTTSWNTNIIAKELGLSAVTLNKRLQGLGIQYKEHGVWVLAHKYQDKGYTKTSTYDFLKQDGSVGTRIQTEWTEKGRRFIHGLYDKGRI